MEVDVDVEGVRAGMCGDGVGCFGLCLGGGGKNTGVYREDIGGFCCGKHLGGLLRTKCIRKISLTESMIRPKRTT